MTIKVFEAFAGIGTQRMALKNIGVDHEVVAISEIDKFAIQSYEAIHGETRNLGDIEQLQAEDIPNHDLFTYSFPCQDLSLSGGLKGFQKGTRSNLLFECKKVIEHKKPQYLLMENVKNLVGKRFKTEFDGWLSWLESQGYTNYWEVLNAEHFGVAQPRERVFVVSVLNNVDTYEFPSGGKSGARLSDVLEDEVADKYFLSDKIQERFRRTKEDNVGVVGTTKPEFRTIGQRDHVYGTEGVMGTLMASDYKQPKQIVVKGVAMRGRYNKDGKIEQQLEMRKDAVANTITTVQKDSMVADMEDEVVRKLTPLETWRLMGIDDSDFYKVEKAGVSDTQLYRQSGNSIVVPVLEGIFSKLFLD